MNLIIDLDSLSVTGTSPLTVVRRKTVPLKIQFSSGGEVKALPSDCVGHYALVVAGVLVSGGLASSWVTTGFGTGTVYTFPLNADTTPLDDLFAGGSPPSSVKATLTIDWSSESLGINAESQPLSVAILNANLLGNEGTPAEIPDAKASDAQAVDSTDTTHWMTPHAVALAIAAYLSNLPTSDPHINEEPYLNGDFIAISRG